jgi:predicted RNA-binding Zn ribbon-like protein
VPHNERPQRPTGRGNGARIVGELRFDAGNLTLDLIATVGRRFGVPVERLTGPSRLADWVNGARLCLPGRAPDMTDVARVREFREHANEVVRSAIAGTTPKGGALEAVNAACGAPVRLRLGADGFGAAAPPTASLADTVIGLVARDMVVLLSGPDRLRVGECAAADCRMLYLRPAGSRRRWCSSAHCGNRNRVAAHYALTKGGPAGEGGHP